MSDDFRSVRENVADLSVRLGKLDGKLTDIFERRANVERSRLAASARPNATMAAAPAGPPAERMASAETLYQNAFRDYSSGKDDLAMDEFTQYLKFFADTENGPSAQYYVGSIYDRAKQYEDGVQAFDAVLERFPENPKTPDALYMKGVELMKGGHRTDAATEFRAFLKRYPDNDLAAKAQSHLREMGLSTARPRRQEAQLILWGRDKSKCLRVPLCERA